MKKILNITSKLKKLRIKKGSKYEEAQGETEGDIRGDFKPPTRKRSTRPQPASWKHNLSTTRAYWRATTKKRKDR
jgi:hypothetical protein